MHPQGKDKLTEYIMREADDNDARGIAGLRLRIREYEALESDNYDLFWKSLILENPCSIRKALVAEDKEGKILAHYAIVPFRFLKGGESLIGGFVCQLMVDEDYRKEFIFPKMMFKMLREYKDLGIDFAFSLSSRADVVKAHEAFGFRRIGDLPVYAKPFKLTKIAPHLIQNNTIRFALKPFLSIAEQFLRIKRITAKGNLIVKDIPRFATDIDSFLEKIQYHFPYSILRNAKILNWRTVDFPTRKYRIITVESDGMMAGYVIVRQMKIKEFNVLAVVDIMYSPAEPDTGIFLLKAVHVTAVNLKVDMTSCLLGQSDPFYPVLKKCGYIKTPESISLFVHEPKGSETGISKSSIDKWHITWLDHDSM
jgi:N-acetylglutamate synthase-like GNAT family acetyltransferase